VDRRKIIYWCDVVLLSLLYLQVIDALKPATVTVAGFTLTVRAAALLPSQHRRW
jgi:hypothetical protein